MRKNAVAVSIALLLPLFAGCTIREQPQRGGDDTAPPPPPTEFNHAVAIVAAGDQSGFDEPTYRVIRKEEDYNVLWARLYPSREVAPRAVDFGNEMVLFATLGQRPTAGYSVRVSRVHEKDKKITVTTTETAPPSGSMTAQVITQPYQLVRMKARAGDVEWVHAMAKAGAPRDTMRATTDTLR